MSVILDFIKIFQSPSNETLFTECACYWFSVILHQRFKSSIIMYNPHLVHFATKIDNKLYDIKGVVTEEEDYIAWEEYKDFFEDATMISKYCIDLERR